jgi:hypothetical protein
MERTLVNYLPGKVVAYGKKLAGIVPSSAELPYQRAEQIAQKVLQQTLSTTEIRQRQQRIHREVLQLSRSMDSSNFKRLDADDLRRMTMLYDQEFFDSALLTTIGRDRIKFALSSRMTRIAGKLVTQYPDRQSKRASGLSRTLSKDTRQFGMVLSSTLLFQAFDDVDRPITVTGLRCTNRLEAMQRVCEHELVHLLEMFFWNDSSCSQCRFQDIAGRFFGHTEHSHDLITQRERAARNFGVRVGDFVRFRHDGKWIDGWVNRITRRATILVEDPRGERFTDGKSYVRFYVPVEQLKLHSSNGGRK